MPSTPIVVVGLGGVVANISEYDKKRTGAFSETLIVILFSN